MAVADELKNSAHLKYFYFLGLVRLENTEKLLLTD
jgi:hypothetical protein